MAHHPVEGVLLHKVLVALFELLLLFCIEMFVTCFVFHVTVLAEVKVKAVRTFVSLKLLALSAVVAEVCTVWLCLGQDLSFVVDAVEIGERVVWSDDHLHKIMFL